MSENEELKAHGWNIEQILVYVWQGLSEGQEENEFPFQHFSVSPMAARLRLELATLAQPTPKGEPREAEDGITWRQTASVLARGLLLWDIKARPVEAMEHLLKFASETEDLLRRAPTPKATDAPPLSTEGLVRRIELLAQGEFTDEWNKGYKQATIDAARIVRERAAASPRGERLRTDLELSDSQVHKNVSAMLETLKTIAEANWMVDSCAQELARQTLEEMAAERLEGKGE